MQTDLHTVIPEIWNADDYKSQCKTESYSFFESYSGLQSNDDSTDRIQ